MNVPTGNGVFAVSRQSPTGSSAYADLGTVSDPSAITGASYTLNFTKDATTGALSYTVTSGGTTGTRSEEHTSELQSQSNLVCRLLLEKKKNVTPNQSTLASKASSNLIST